MGVVREYDVACKISSCSHDTMGTGRRSSALDCSGELWRGRPARGRGDVDRGRAWRCRTTFSVVRDDATQRFVEAMTRARIDAEKDQGREIPVPELARRLNISTQSAYAYLNGTTVPRSLLLDKLLEVWGITGARRGWLATLRDDAELARRRRPGQPRSSVRRQVPHELPTQPEGFVGRAAELGQLNGVLDRWRMGRGPTVTAVISGTAGVGKTTLAVAWAHRIAGSFPDGQLYADLRGYDPAGTPLSPAKVLRRFLEACGEEPVRLPDTLDELTTRYRTTMAGRRVLVLLDNAHDGTQVRPLLPGGTGCLVVATSRAQLSDLIAREHAWPIILDVLEDHDAATLLKTRLDPARVEAEPAAITELVERCARLPLALAVTATRAALNPRLPLSAIAAELRDEKRRLDALNAGEPVADIQSVFSWSYRQLSDPSSRMFRLLGLHPGTDISAAAAAALADIPLEVAHRVLSELVRANLLVEHMPDRFTCHDLLWSYAAKLADLTDPAERSPALRRMLGWYLHTADAAGRTMNPDRRRQPPPEPHCPRIRFTNQDHALQWYEHERVNLVAMTKLAADRGEYAVAWQLPVAMVDYLDRRKHWSDWIESHTVGLTAADQLADPFARAAIRNSLGVALRELGRLDEALHLYHEALEIQNETGDSYSKAMLLGNLGNIHTALEQPELGIDFHRKAVALLETTDNLYGKGLALGNLGWAYFKAGRLTEALASYDRSLEICRAIHDRLGEAATLDSLGETLRAAGRTAEAAERFHTALPIRREVGDRYGELITLTNLGDVLHDTNQTVLAHAYWKEAAAIAEELGDPGADEVRGRPEACGCASPRG